MKKAIIAFIVITAVLSCSKMSQPTTASATDPASASAYALPTATPGMKTWVQSERFCDFTARAFQGMYSINDRLYVVAGRGVSKCSGDTWWTSDCETWVTSSAKAEFAPRDSFAGVVFNNKMWVIGGSDKNIYFKDVWSSSDGVTWTAAAITWTAAASVPGFSERAGLSAAVLKDVLYIAAGSNGKKELNDVWSSKDGNSWTRLKEDNDKGFPQRTGHKLLSYAGKLWIIGGKNGAENFLSDVWSSENGIDWKIATPNAGFSGRSDFAAITYKERMWVMGGMGAKGAPNNDVWWTVNGYYWVSTTAKADFEARSGFNSAEYKGRVYLTGGISGGKLKRDLWVSQ